MASAKTKIKSTSKSTTSQSPRLALVRWIDDEMVGVVPVSASTEKNLHVGSITKMKYVGKLYDVEILVSPACITIAI